MFQSAMQQIAFATTFINLELAKKKPFGRSHLPSPVWLDTLQVPNFSRRNQSSSAICCSRFCFRESPNLTKRTVKPIQLHNFSRSIGLTLAALRQLRVLFLIAERNLSAHR
jgi:hypothetical protein